MSSSVAYTGLGIALILFGVGLLFLATMHVLGRSPTARAWPYAVAGFASALAGDALFSVATE